MKVKRLAAITLTLAALGAGMVYASGGPWGEYEGFTKVRVLVNNEEIEEEDVPAFVINGRAVLPLRSVANSLQVLVQWDDETKTAVIHKPNVHMFVAQRIGKDDSLITPFGKVTRDNKGQSKTMDFVVSAQVDSLKTAIHSFKIEMLNPQGTVIRSSETVQPDGKDSFWYTWPVEGVSFDMTGEYKLRFMVRPDAESGFVSVSERTIVSE